MKKIEAQIVADSISPQGHRITSFLLTFPRFILAELNTHRLFSRNSASSRAIPFEKMVKMVKEDPFIPIAWQKDHKGMQGTEYLTEEEATTAEVRWIAASHNAITSAKMLNNNYFGVQRPLVTKQLCNRLLEPFQWHTTLVTATEFENFFELRLPKYQYKREVFNSKKELLRSYTFEKGFKEDRAYLESLSTIDWLTINTSQAEIHIQALAEAMWDAMDESSPKELKAGKWHIPFGDNMNISINDPVVINEASKIVEFITNDDSSTIPNIDYPYIMEKIKIKVAVARCARLSYMTFDGEIDYEKDIKMHDSLLLNRHASPFEHICRCLTEKEYNTLGKMILDPTEGYIFEKGWVDNFKGFISYRRILNF